MPECKVDARRSLGIVKGDVDGSVVSRLLRQDKRRIMQRVGKCDTEARAQHKHTGPDLL